MDEEKDEDVRKEVGAIQAETRMPKKGIDHFL